MPLRHPVWLQRITTPGADAMALLFAFESAARALLISLIPLEAYRLLGDASQVSALIFAASLVGLAANFAVPWLVRRVGRRWVYSLGGLLLIASVAVMALDTLPTLGLGMAVRALGIVSLGVCLNLYIMDHVARSDFSRSEPKRIFYSAAAWVVGPGLGVILGSWLGPWAAYGASGCCALLLLGYFWFLRLSDSRGLIKGPAPVASPARNIRRFLAQPRLKLAWLIAFSRYVWWGIFMIYTPIYAVESGLGAVTGGLIVSAGTAFLFLMPLWGWCARAFGLRRLLVYGFTGAGLLTLIVVPLSALPWLAAIVLLAAALCMVTLDAVGNIPFMLAVRPRERPEMTTVYATYRDLGEIAPPGVFALLLRVFELPAVFLAGGLAMLLVAQVCRRMNPRLGRAARPRPASPCAAQAIEPAGGAGR